RVEEVVGSNPATPTVLGGSRTAGASQFLSAIRCCTPPPATVRTLCPYGFVGYQTLDGPQPESLVYGDLETRAAHVFDRSTAVVFPTDRDTDQFHCRLGETHRQRRAHHVI